MSSNVAIRLEPTTVKRALLVRVEPGQVHVRGAAGREAHEAEDDVLDRRAHVALAARLDLGRLLAEQVQQDGDVVRAERPQRVLVRAQLAEVEAVRVDVVQVAELAGVGDLLERRDGRVVLEQVADHQQPLARSAAATARSASATVVASGFSTKQCLPASSTRSASAAWVGTGVASTTASSVVVGEHLVEVAGVRAPGCCAPTRASASARASHSQATSQPGSAAKLRARFGPQ